MRCLTLCRRSKPAVYTIMNTDLKIQHRVGSGFYTPQPKNAIWSFVTTIMHYMKTAFPVMALAKICGCELDDEVIGSIRDIDDVTMLGDKSKGYVPPDSTAITTYPFKAPKSVHNEKKK